MQDSAYGYINQIAAMSEAGAYGVNAFYPGTFPLEDVDGKAIDLVAWLKERRAREGSIKSLSAFFWENGKIFGVRVIALRRTKEQMERDLTKKKRTAGRLSWGLHQPAESLPFIFNQVDVL